MIPLLVQVTDASSASNATFAFDRSPVRFGRNQLNDLAISDGVVSQWHGVLRFDENSMVYVDLGSTNGTTFNGQRIPRNTEIPLAPGQVLQIAHLQLRLARGMVPPEMLTRRENSFLPATATAGQQPPTSRTVMFNAGSLLAQQPAPADPRIVEQIAQQTNAVYEQYVRSLSEVIRYLEHYIGQLPAEQRGPTLLALAERFPHFARTREFRRLGLKAGLLPEQVGDVDLEDWLKRLIFGSEEAVAARGRIDVHQSMQRIGALLETFAQSFVDLRSGHEQFITDIGLRLNMETGGLADARSARTALAYLLDWTSDSRARVDELNRAFADLALHQVGLLNGIIEGVRSVLTSVRPEVIAGMPPSAPRNEDVRSGSAGGLMGAKVKQWWRAFSAKHGELEDGDRFTREVFGRAFATAYFTIMGSGRR